LGGVAATVVHAQASGGTAVYWMTADTMSGMGTMMANSGGGGMNMGAMMRMAQGGQSSYVHNIRLELGTGRTATGEPAATHAPPPGLQVGPSLPLLTPRRATGQTPYGIEKPKGRLLVYWGCGDRVRAGQPVVLDYAAMAAGKMPPAFASVRSYSGPSQGKYTTYGEWPNSQSSKQVPASGSLVGSHVVSGNYTPQIQFTMAPGQDFLGPVAISGNEAGPSGSVPLRWRPVTGAKAWSVSTMGAARNGDMILWSSSELQSMPATMTQISPDEITRLVQNKVLLPAAATSCTVPAEIAAASESSVLMTTAFGTEYNFSHPMRPAKAPPGWRPDWTVKVLTKSTYTGMLGMDMAAMMGGGYGDSDEPRPSQPQPQKKKRSPFGLGDLLRQ
jgi:hypothetical protein